MLSAMGDPKGEGKGGFVLLDENFKAYLIWQHFHISLRRILAYQIKSQLFCNILVLFSRREESVILALMDRGLRCLPVFCILLSCPPSKRLMVCILVNLICMLLPRHPEASSMPPSQKRIEILDTLFESQRNPGVY